MLWPICRTAHGLCCAAKNPLAFEPFQGMMCTSVLRTFLPKLGPPSGGPFFLQCTRTIASGEEAAGLVLPEGLADLQLRIHDEGAAEGHGPADRRARIEQRPERGSGPDRQA